MTNPRRTINEVYNMLADVRQDVKELKDGKVDRNIYAKDLEIIEGKIDNIRSDVSNISSYAKWAVLLVLGMVITAIVNLVLRTQ